LHGEEHKKKTKKMRAKAPLPPAPLTTATHKASPPNYAHKYKKVKKSGVESPPFIGNGRLSCT